MLNTHVKVYIHPPKGWPTYSQFHQKKESSELTNQTQWLSVEQLHCFFSNIPCCLINIHIALILIFHINFQLRARLNTSPIHTETKTSFRWHPPSYRLPRLFRWSVRQLHQLRLQDWVLLLWFDRGQTDGKAIMSKRTPTSWWVHLPFLLKQWRFLSTKLCMFKTKIPLKHPRCLKSALYCEMTETLLSTPFPRWL